MTPHDMQEIAGAALRILRLIENFQPSRRIEIMAVANALISTEINRQVLVEEVKREIMQ